MYAIVKFVDEWDAPEIVCSHWIHHDEKTCLYPNVRINEARDKLLRKLVQPAQDWISCRIKILHKYSSFSEAVSNLSKAEETSSLETEDEAISSRPRTKVKRCIRYPGESESDEDCGPPLSQKSKISKKICNVDPYPIPQNFQVSTYEPHISPISYCESQSHILSDSQIAAKSYSEFQPHISTDSQIATKSFSELQLQISPTPDTKKQPHTASKSDSELQQHIVPTSYSVLPNERNTQIMSNAFDECMQYESPFAPSHLQKQSTCCSRQSITNGKLLAWMADIADKVKQVDDKIEKLLLKNQQVPESIERNEDLEILGSLPVTNDLNFVEFNKKIFEENRLRHLLIKVLISVGGKDMRCHIHNMLRRLLSDEVAELYTLSGKSTLKNVIKKSFLATPVSKSIFSACQRVYKDMATEVKMKEAVGDWLSQAKVRKDRRIQRHETIIEKNVA